MPLPSKIFAGYRALGFVSNHVPLDVRYHRKHRENYVVTCVGKAFHVYNCSKLGITSVSNVHSDDITCLAVDANLVYTACENDIQAYAKGRQVCHEYKGHTQKVHLLLPFSHHLLSVDVAGNIKVWHIESEELYTEIRFNPASFDVSALMHPTTYLNKVLFGSSQGSMQLWNVHTNKRIFTFLGWNSPITTIAQAPAVDVVAVGLADGRIVLHNLKFDETLMTFTQDWGPVTTITFRTDGHPIMVTGSPAGHIALWNLEERKLQSQIREAHNGAVTGMQCLPSEPLMVTSSPDNSLKVWIFDQPDGGGRLLRQRTGHSAPPTRVRYHDRNGQQILSAGQDSTLRTFSTVHDRHNRSLGRASYNKAATKKSGLKADTHMMPPIISFASDPSRQSDWDSVVACHRNERMATTWNLNRYTMGSHKLMHGRFAKPEYKSAEATCVDVSPCGNFCVVGYSSGHVDTYNMQSGRHRGSYGQKTAHKGALRSVCIDGLNQQTITAGGDRKLKFWRFKSKELLYSKSLPTHIATLLLHRDSGMMAVALDNFEVIIVDIESRKTVRTFSGHRNRVTGMAFSNDGRWLVTTSMDCSFRTWDLPSGRLLDCFLVQSPATSVALSPTADFLATTHVDHLGVYLWSNLTIYEHVPLRPLPENYQPKHATMPATGRARGARKEEEDEEEEDEKQYLLSEFKSPEQLSDELVTLSLLPNSRWQSLLNLDVIKERNKPKEPPKVPKAAPFFLPTISGLETKFAPIEDEDKDKEDAPAIQGSLLPLTEVGQLLMKCDKTGHFTPVLEKIKQLGPSAIDSELRSLGPDGGGSVALLATFLRALAAAFATNRDFELVQAYLGLFMKLHGEAVSTEEVLRTELRAVRERQDQAWASVQQLLHQSLCLVNFLNSATAI